MGARADEIVPSTAFPVFMEDWICLQCNLGKSGLEKE